MVNKILAFLAGGGVGGSGEILISHEGGGGSPFPRLGKCQGLVGFEVVLLFHPYLCRPLVKMKIVRARPGNGNGSPKSSVNPCPQKCARMVANGVNVALRSTKLSTKWEKVSVVVRSIFYINKQAGQK